MTGRTETDSIDAFSSASSVPEGAVSASTSPAVRSTPPPRSVPFATFDILSDPNMRQGVKDYAQWPTFPQLYVGGEFVGGCDIVTEMYQNGELQTLIKGVG